MKITLNLPVRRAVGTRYVDVYVYYDAADRVPLVNETVSTAYETKIEPVTVFDYDFQAKRRLVAALHLKVFTLGIIAITPLAVIHVAGALVGKGLERLAEKIGSVFDLTGVPFHWSIPDTYRVLWARLTK